MFLGAPLPHPPIIIYLFPTLEFQQKCHLVKGGSKRKKDQKARPDRNRIFPSATSLSFLPFI